MVHRKKKKSSSNKHYDIESQEQQAFGTEGYYRTSMNTTIPHL